MNVNPTVSIAIPVYNGENYIREAIESFLNQTYTDFELILSDNCSTDRTWAICQEYAEKDARIRLHQHEKNIGANQNFNSVVALARGKYFKWAAHDDRVAPTYLEKCVEILDNDPSVVLCHSQTQLIDKNGALITQFPKNGRLVDDDGGVVFIGLDPVDRKLDSHLAYERFYAVIVETVWVYDVFGVIRTHLLRETALLEEYYGTDVRVLVDLAMQGRFVIIPEPLFFNRRHPKQSASQITSEEKLDWSNPTSRKNEFTYRWLRFRGFARAILNGRMSLRERIGCFWVLIRYYVRFRRVYNMLEEITGLRRYKIRREMQQHSSTRKTS